MPKRKTRRSEWIDVCNDPTANLDHAASARAILDVAIPVAVTWAAAILDVATIVAMDLAVVSAVAAALLGGRIDQALLELSSICTPRTRMSLMLSNKMALAVRVRFRLAGSEA